MVLKILRAPDPILKSKALRIQEMNGDIAKLVDDMIETMYASNGIGLAANQVGQLKRVVVMDISHREGAPKQIFKLINPEVVWSSEEDNCYDEGCLSFPGQFAEVIRPAEVKVKYIDYDGNEQIIEADGLLATCVQHEIDHLDGITFVDHISRLKRDMIMRKLQKALKEEQDENPQANA